MRRLRAWTRRLVGLFTSTRRDRELAAELDSHLQLHMDDNLRAGMSPAEARRQALLMLGGLDATTEAYRDRSRLPAADHLMRDVRFALRQLRKHPSFTAAAVFVLALGIGASVTVFIFVDAALIKPLPYEQPSRLVDVTERVQQIPRAALSLPDYLDWKAGNSVFSAFDVYTETGFILSTPSGAQPVTAMRVTAGFFRTLGVAPALGRDFRSEDDKPGAPAVVLLSHAAWLARFGGQAEMVGQSITLDGEPRTIIGVLPESFQFAPAGDQELWTPLGKPTGCERRRSCHDLSGVARLKDDATIETARAQMVAIASQLERQYPDSNRGQGAAVSSLTEVIVGDVRPTLLLLMGGAVLLLFIACVNVTSLLIVRTEARTRELAVRAALGASRARLVSQFVTEAVVLVAIGAGIGLLAARWAIGLPASLVPEEIMMRMPFLHGIGFNARVAGYAAAIFLLAVVFLSAAPLIRVSKLRTQAGMPDGGRGSSGRTWHRLGGRLVVLELALAVVLLAGAGLLGRSVYRLMHVDLGFNPDSVALVAVAATGPRYLDNASQAKLGRDLADRLRRVPGVTAVGLTSVPPVSFNGNTIWIRIPGQTYHGEHNEVNMREVSAGYFDALQTTLIGGRHFTEQDDAAHPKVAIINRALARQYFGTGDPIGQQIGDTNLSRESMAEVVGLVDDLREGPLDASVWPAIYFPFSQAPESYFRVVVRSGVPSSSMLPAIDAAIHQFDRDLGTIGLTTMRQHVDNSPSAYLHRSTAWLVAGFAGVAWVLGIVGLYGVMAYLVSQRTREIGVRMALGAERQAVSRLVVRDAGTLAVIGIVIGLALAVAVATLMRDLLFGTMPWDGATLISVAVVLGCSAIAASYIPARRAAAVNPIDALRSE